MNTNTFYCGIDLHARNLFICVIDQEGHKVAEKRLKNYMNTILDFLSPYLHNLNVAVESTLNWYWLVDGLQEQGIPVSLAHTLYLKAI